MIIKEPEKAKQLVCFDGLTLQGRHGYNNVWPTDIDGYIQLDVENLFIFLELKFKGGMKYGQDKALTRLADAIGENAYVLLAEHDVADPRRPIMAKDAIVIRIYRGRMGWYETAGTVKSIIDKMITQRREVRQLWKTR